MPLLSTFPTSFSNYSTMNLNPVFHPSFSQNPIPNSYFPPHSISSSPLVPNLTLKRLPLFTVSATSDPNRDPNSKPKTKRRRPKREIPDDQVVENSSEIFPTTKPRKPRRGRRSEASAVEDFVRDSLERTFASIKQKNSEAFGDKKVFKDRVEEEEKDDDDDDDDDKDDNVRGKTVVVEEDNPDWPLDADVGWGIRASEYFEKHPIRNVVAEDGVEIDWEGEIDDTWVKEINCLEWESFAFHPSPLIVLVFERYNRATDNWKLLKELENAIKVYWKAKDRLPPRAVKIDINIERDLAYALKVRECPQLLFLRGNKILYREKDIRTVDELVHMIAHFYYNAKKPSWIVDAYLAPPY
ncbi:thioredoxin-like fold domain-containing protein MRL7, chloroplastic [Macadamia integrifolia]|uniref:thioredoxin-like fold domain-containing protein MRL7, chloroplastic n=1 Tax=Macadamia integrifolia TaxID=60698 RepID=UPI001C532D5A|nr:thioredoxin-like fold domain-containing protein MRL7, chloroplastic [Macadamia integrifolia]XP_042519861.1 thioredoxin-like fold domain-containing protein MRL7, chloroplastic [Macadamia integrifolia]